MSVKPFRKLCQAQDKKVVAGYLDGRTIRELMLEFSIGQTAVKTRLIEAGVPSRSRGFKKTKAP